MFWNTSQLIVIRVYNNIESCRHVLIESEIPVVIFSMLIYMIRIVDSRSMKKECKFICFGYRKSCNVNKHMKPYIVQCCFIKSNAFYKSSMVCMIQCIHIRFSACSCACVAT